MEQDCVFCKIVKGEIPSKKEYENEDVFAFHDINPVAPVHILIIPKRHIKNISGAKNDDVNILGKCQIAARDVAEKLGISSAFRLATANGKEAGQSVFHLHYHLVGGWKDKTKILSWEKTLRSEEHRI